MNFPSFQVSVPSNVMGGGHAGLHTTIVFVTVIQEAIGEINTFNWLDGWMVGLAKKHGDHGDLGSDDLGDIYVYIYTYTLSI